MYTTEIPKRITRSDSKEQRNISWLTEKVSSYDELRGTFNKKLKNSQFENECIDKFLNTWDEIVLNKENSLIKDILQYFDEEIPIITGRLSRPVVLWSIFQRNIYIRLLNNLNLIMPKAMTFVYFFGI